MPCVALPTSWQISRGTCDRPRLLRRTIGGMNRIHVGIARGLPTKFGLFMRLFDLAFRPSPCQLDLALSNRANPHEPRTGTWSSSTRTRQRPGRHRCVSHGPGFPGPLSLLVRFGGASLSDLAAAGVEATTTVPMRYFRHGSRSGLIPMPP